MPTKKKVDAPEASDLVTLSYEGATIEVDLRKQCPTKLFKKLDTGGKRPQMYIPAPLVREVIRSRGGIEVCREELKTPIIGQQTAILMAEAEVVVDGETFCGTGLDVVSLKKLAVAAMGQGGHVTALAVKSALKKRFKFFEGDFATAEMEGADIEDINLDELANEIGKVAEQPTQKQEPIPEPPVAAAEIPTAVVEVEAPGGTETIVGTDQQVETAESPVDIDDVTVVPTSATNQEPAQDPTPQSEQAVDFVSKFLFLLEESKKSGQHSLLDLQNIGKGVIAEYNIEKGNEQHKKLLAIASEKMEWFTK